MPFHDQLSFNELHKAKFQAGATAELPAEPEGVGDVFWDSEAGDLYIANAEGTEWVKFEAGGGGLPEMNLNDLQDVNTVAENQYQVLMWDGDEWSNNYLYLSQLWDVNILFPTHHSLLVWDEANTRWTVLYAPTAEEYTLRSYKPNPSADIQIRWERFSFDMLLSDDDGNIMTDDDGNPMWVE